MGMRQIHIPDRGCSNPVIIHYVEAGPLGEDFVHTCEVIKPPSEQNRAKQFG